jgi:hypothetical protein
VRLPDTPPKEIRFMGLRMNIPLPGPFSYGVNLSSRKRKQGPSAAELRRVQRYHEVRPRMDQISRDLAALERAYNAGEVLEAECLRRQAEIEQEINKLTRYYETGQS